jgi:hypothetical protein
LLQAGEIGCLSVAVLTEGLGECPIQPACEGILAPTQMLGFAEEIDE